MVAGDATATVAASNTSALRSLIDLWLGSLGFHGCGERALLGAGSPSTSQVDFWYRFPTLKLSCKRVK